MKPRALFLALFLVCAAVLGSSGCYRTMITNGYNGPEAPSVVYDNRWYHGLIALVDLTGPVDLNQVCPSGAWTRITLQTSFLNGLIGGLIPFYTPQTATVFCATGAAYGVRLNSEGKAAEVLSEDNSRTAASQSR
ncbi:MAG: hypothetical protein AAGC55_01815 [Myxococcota bacterium]